MTVPLDQAAEAQTLISEIVALNDEAENLCRLDSFKVATRHANHGHQIDPDDLDGREKHLLRYLVLGSYHRKLRAAVLRAREAGVRFSRVPPRGEWIRAKLALLPEAAE